MNSLMGEKLIEHKMDTPRSDSPISNSAEETEADIEFNTLSDDDSLPIKRLTLSAEFS